MNKLSGRFFEFLAIATLLMSTLPARAQQSVVSLPNLSVQSEAYFINVRHKSGPAPNKVPVLLVHGSWGNGQTFDFPGRSLMDYLAVRGYDVYALDLRGMGESTPVPAGPLAYLPIDIPGRVRDAAAVAKTIAMNTLRVPVVIGWSQGGLIAGLLAASDTQHQLVAGVGLLSVAPDGFTVPTNLLPPISGEAQRILFSMFPEAVTPSPSDITELLFGTDPVTGKSTISPDAFATFDAPPFLQPDSSIAVVEESNQCPIRLTPTFVIPCAHTVAWGSITVPALVVDGALDLFVGTDLSQMLFTSLGSANKQLIVFPRNSHAWFLEDNYDATDRVFDRFLSQF